MARSIQFTFILILFLSMAFIANGQAFEELQWEKRVIVISDLENDIPRRNEQLETLLSDRDALVERDLIILVYNGKSFLDEEEKPASYSSPYISRMNYQGLLLIGKDGGLKMKKPFLVRSEEVFTLIDGMPMRKVEIEASDKY